MRAFLSVVNVIALLARSSIAHPLELWDTPFSLVRRAVSPDNTCGMTGSGANNGYTCPTGGEYRCCSQYGWCGSTTDHCGTGCQTAYGTCTTPSSTTTPTTPSSTTTPTTPSSTDVPLDQDDFLCGPTNGNKKCRTGYCCSQYGYCGITSGYCDVATCQSAFGVCGTTGTSTTGTGTATNPTQTPDPEDDDGTCGPANGNKICTGGKCCSPSGYCGTTKDYCQSPDCLRGFGICDADTVPPGSSTLGVVRTLAGSIPYGADIYDCEEEGTLAITYDDGPFIYTNDVLDLLASYNAKATFFVTGINNGKGRIDDTTLPWGAMITRMIAEGHQVASHTWSHADLSTLSEDDRKAEMVKNEMALRNIIGKWPTYMRPPYSSCNEDCMDTMNELGYHIIYFDFDTEDYLHTTPATNELSKIVIRNTLATPADNYLSIMHDIHEQTAHNLTSFFLEQATAKGFRFVTVGECLGDPEANWYRTT